MSIEDVIRRLQEDRAIAERECRQARIASAFEQARQHHMPPQREVKIIEEVKLSFGAKLAPPRTQPKSLVKKEPKPQLSLDEACKVLAIGVRASSHSRYRGHHQQVYHITLPRESVEEVLRACQNIVVDSPKREDRFELEE